MLEGKIVHIHDIQKDQEFALELSKLRGFRTQLGVPLLREAAPIGVMVLTRHAPRPFTAKQIELVTTFADQAVIAIEKSTRPNYSRNFSRPTIRLPARKAAPV